MKTALIRQHDEKDCGAACLGMILAHYGRKLPLASLRKAVSVDQYGANIYGLIEGAKANGLLGEAYDGDAPAVWEAITAGEASLPLIARIVNSDGFEHYVVITEVKQNKLSVNDPGAGCYSLTREDFEGIFLGQIVVFQKEQSFCKENLKKHSVIRFLSIITKQKKLLLFIGVLSLIVTLIGLAGAFLFRYLIDSVTGNMTGSADAESALSGLAGLIGALVILYFFRLFVSLIRGKLLTTMSKQLDLPLMLGYYDHVTELPMDFFGTRKTGEIMSRFGDAAKIRDAISGVTLTLMIDVVMVIACGAVLYKESPVIFFASGAIFVIYMIISVCYVKPIERLNRDLMEQNARFESYLKETIDGMETVKVAQAEASVRERAHQLFITFLDRGISGTMMELTKESLVQLVTSLGTLVVIWVGAVQVVSGQMSVGTLVTCCSLMSYFLDPVQNLVDLQGSIQSALVAMDRLNDVLDLDTECAGDRALAQKITSIGFDSASFRYGTRELVLQNVSFSAKRGEQIALVGESGCGKSTVTRLLMGLYTPEEGRVLINGVSADTYTLSSLRERIAYVPQSTFLFGDTIRANLLLGLPEDKIPTEETLAELLQKACCDFVFRLPFGIDTVLEENGTNLSGGQRQRLAIARALLRQPDVLILDEATSALDNVTEHCIREAISEICPEMIVVMIAHRLSTVKKCSHIMVMDQGRVVEDGTHETLLAQQGRYTRLWEKNLTE